MTDDTRELRELVAQLAEMLAAVMDSSTPYLIAHAQDARDIARLARASTPAGEGYANDFDVLRLKVRWLHAASRPEEEAAAAAFRDDVILLAERIWARDQRLVQRLADAEREREGYKDAMIRALAETADWRNRLGWTRDAVQRIDAILGDAKLPNVLEHGGDIVDHVRTIVQRLAAAQQEGT